MPQFPPPNPDWFARHWFRGVFLHDGGRREGPFQVAIDLNPDGTRNLRGYVIGDDAAAARLRFPRGRLRLESAEGSEHKISVEGVFIGTLYPDSRSDFSRLVAEFSANTAVVEYHDLPDRSDIELVFVLNGPRRFWPTWRDGHEYRDNEFTLDDCSFDVRRVSGRRRLSETRERSREIVQLSVRPLPGASNLAPD